MALLHREETALTERTVSLMAPARSTTARAGTPMRRRPAHRAARPSGGVQLRLNWDRFGRLIILSVCIVLAYLYAGPLYGLYESWGESKQREQQLQTLESRNHQLKERREALSDPATLEQEARRLGKVRPGERPYVIEGLPKN